MLLPRLNKIQLLSVTLNESLQRRERDAASLQSTHAAEKQTREQLQVQVQALLVTESEYGACQQDLEDLQAKVQEQTRTILDYERTLEEMGVHLSE